jgi:hypothetical protein
VNRICWRTSSNFYYQFVGVISDMGYQQHQHLIFITVCVYTSHSLTNTCIYNHEKNYFKLKMKRNWSWYLSTTTWKFMG